MRVLFAPVEQNFLTGPEIEGIEKYNCNTEFVEVLLKFHKLGQPSFGTCTPVSRTSFSARNF